MAEAQYLMASRLRLEGRTPEAMDGAMDMLANVVAIRSKCLAEADPDLSSAETALATDYIDGAQVSVAVKMLERVVEKSQELSQTDDPVRLESHFALASAYPPAKQWPQALEILESDSKIVHGLPTAHPTRRPWQRALGFAYIHNDQVSKAIETLERLLSSMKVLPDRAMEWATKYVLAEAYSEDGRPTEAIDLLKLVLEVQDGWPEDSPSRLTTQHSLAGAYYARGDTKQGIRLLGRVVAISQRKWPNDPSRWTTAQAQLQMMLEKNAT